MYLACNKICERHQVLFQRQLFKATSLTVWEATCTSVKVISHQSRIRPVCCIVARCGMGPYAARKCTRSEHTQIDQCDCLVWRDTLHRTEPLSYCAGSGEPEPVFYNYSPCGDATHRTQCKRTFMKTDRVDEDDVREADLPQHLPNVSLGTSSPVHTNRSDRHAVRK